LKAVGEVVGLRAFACRSARRGVAAARAGDVWGARASLACARGNSSASGCSFCLQRARGGAALPKRLAAAKPLISGFK